MFYINKISIAYNQPIDYIIYSLTWKTSYFTFYKTKVWNTIICKIQYKKKDIRPPKHFFFMVGQITKAPTIINNL
jgi:hypothetical protein